MFRIHKILIEEILNEKGEVQETDIHDEDELTNLEFGTYEQAKLEYDKMKY